ncbi:MAG: response regulator [Deltaproteobacteria bacterium]|nr:response regulator [Deltaproteobacteria bacterium]
MAIRSKKILVVDDDELIRECCIELLANRGYTVDTAANGMAAIERLGASAYDLVISDVNMPLLDGIGLFLSVLREFPYLKDRFFFMTGDVAEGTEGPVLKGLGKRVIAKPFKVKEFLDAVDACLEPSAFSDSGGPLKRRRERFAFVADCTVEFGGPEGRFSARVLDISENGLKLKYLGDPKGADAAAGVYIKGLDLKRTGRVKWSRSAEGTVIAGIELTEPLPVSSVLNGR